MGFFTLMKGSAQDVCTFFNVQWHFKEFSIEKTQSKSSPYHPQSQGALERWHQAFNEKLLLRDWNRLGWLHLFANVCSSPENRSNNLSDTVPLRLCLDTLWGGLLALLSSTSESIRLLEYVSHFRTKPYRACELARANLSLSQKLTKKNHCLLRRGLMLYRYINKKSKAKTLSL